MIKEWLKSKFIEIYITGNIKNEEAIQLITENIDEIYLKNNIPFDNFELDNIIKLNKKETFYKFEGIIFNFSKLKLKLKIKKKRYFIFI
jgi:hypothetical protein